MLSLKSSGKGGQLLIVIAAFGLIIHGSAGMVRGQSGDLRALREIQLWSGVALMGYVLTKDADRNRDA